MKFKVTRLFDPGTGVLAPSTGDVALEQYLRGSWRTLHGSRKRAVDGHHTFWYFVTGRIKVRAKSLGPTSYSDVIKLRFLGRPRP